MSLLTLLTPQGASSSQTITLTRLESTAQIYPPSVLLAGGAQTITLNHLASTAVIFAPTVREAQEPQTQLGGFVVPSEKKKRPAVKKKRLKKLPATGLTPKKVAEAARYKDLDEMQRRLQLLASDVEIELLQKAEAELDRAIQTLMGEQEQRLAQEQLALEQRARETVAALLEQAERRAREELLEVEELLDAMDALGY